MGDDRDEGRRPPRSVGGELKPLLDALQRQRDRDLLGPDPVAAHVTHSEGFAAALGGPAPRRALDLGSGGGVPGLVLAVTRWPEAEVVLVDASQRRCTYLELVIGELGLAPRVSVRWGRAEEVGREPTWRAGADVVVARSFGPPGVVAECAAPLLSVGGHLVVSDPPDGGPERWPAEGLARVGLERVGTRQHAEARYMVLRQVRACPEGFPRRPGLPARRPLF